MKPSFAICTSLLILAGIASPTLASDRYPNAREMQSLMQQLKQNIPKLQRSRLYQDRRSPAQKQQVTAFSQDWSSIDPTVAPFLGQWTAIEETKSIYPSRTKGRVCIIDTFLPERRDSSGISFTLGTVANRVIRTDDKLILVKEGDFLGANFVTNGKANVYEYAHPRPLKHPASDKYWSKETAILQAFQKAGCVAESTR